jgi:hypothetical protein
MGPFTSALMRSPRWKRSRRPSKSSLFSAGLASVMMSGATAVTLSKRAPALKMYHIRFPVVWFLSSDMYRYRCSRFVYTSAGYSSYNFFKLCALRS